MVNSRKNKKSLLSRLRQSRAGLLIACVLLLLAIGGVTWANFGDSSSSDSDNTAGDNGTNGESGINYGPPTETEKKETEAHKQSLANEQNSPPPITSSGKKQVDPIITSVYGSEVRSYVSGVIEDGGTCTATATKSGASAVTGSSTGFFDAAYTGCLPISLALSGGGWSVVVSYSSSTAEGKSQAYEVN